MLHGRVRRTWFMMNKVFLNNRVPIRRVANMVDECAICGMSDSLKPVQKFLKSELARVVVELYTVAITPTSKSGYTAIVVIVNHFTHLTYLHPVKDHTAEEVCGA